MQKHYPKSLNQAFYRKHWKLFYRLLNHAFVGWFFRRLLQIQLPMHEKIGFLHPNGFSVHEDGASFRAELWHYDHISLRVYCVFGWLFRLFHLFDLYVANPFVPALNLGFDEYDDVDVTIVVAGTASTGYTNYDLRYSFSEIRSASGNRATSSNVMIARLLASRWNKFCYLSRGIISYNTSFLTYNDIITEATLRLYLVHPVNYTSTLANDNLVITSHDKITSLALYDNDITNDDFGISHFGNIIFSELSWSNYVLFSPATYHFNLNQDGIDYIYRHRHTAFGLMIKLDLQNTDPSGIDMAQGDQTYYTIQIPSTGSSFTVRYTSLENQIVMIM